MHLQVKMPGNGGRNIFRDKQTTNKIALMFLDVKVLTEREQLRFWTMSTKKQGAVYVFRVKNLKINGEKGEQ